MLESSFGSILSPSLLLRVANFDKVCRSFYARWNTVPFCKFVNTIPSVPFMQGGTLFSSLPFGTLFPFIPFGTLSQWSRLIKRNNAV